VKIPLLFAAANVLPRCRYVKNKPIILANVKSAMAMRIVMTTINAQQIAVIQIMDNVDTNKQYVKRLPAKQGNASKKRASACIKIPAIVSRIKTVRLEVEGIALTAIALSQY
jgi:hypothetical protein